MNPIIAITGPTAVGKSAVADQVALALGTDVLSADAMQVYRGMDIGTAKTPVEQRPVPLRLVDLVDPCEAYSAALYQRDARLQIARLHSEARRAVFCGGTGLYLRAALDVMDFPKGLIQDARRSSYQELHARVGDEGIHALLAKRDPASAGIIHPHNVKRVIRALEMCDEGISYAEHAAGFSMPKAAYPHMTYALDMNRERLYARIDSRVDAMMEQGLLTEVKGLVNRGARGAITSRQAIGYKELMNYLDGLCSLDAAIELIKRRSRRYAKRQLAWCRRDARIRWIDLDALGVEGAAEVILNETRGS